MTEVRVLVVEDEPVAAQTMERVLARAGCDVRTAGTCADARRLAREWLPHLAFLDRQLPDGDGLELADHLRSASPDMRLVLLTGDVSAAATSALDAVLVKPVALRALLGQVDEHRRRSAG